MYYESCIRLGLPRINVRHANELMMVLVAAAFKGYHRYCITHLVYFRRETRIAALVVIPRLQWVMEEKCGWTLSCHTIQCIFPVIPKNKYMRSTTVHLEILIFRALKEERERSGRSSV